MQETNKDSALEMRFKQLKKYVTIGLVGVLLLSLLGTLYMGTLKQTASVSEQNQQTQSKVILDSNVCKVYPDQDLCTLAKQIAANPKEAVIPKDGLNGKDGSNGKNGADGSNGVDGRGVSTFTQKDGHLFVTYTDAQTQDLGPVVGKDGTAGKDGATGAAGRGIIAANVIQGSLVISYTDGTTQDAGLIVGPKGDKGDTGAPGPTGAPGAPGANGTNALMATAINTDAAGYVTITYSDGSTATAGRVILPTVETFACSGGVLTLKLTNQAALTTPVVCSLPGLGK